MSTDIFTQTLISDGMELDPVDMSRLSARALAYLYDQVVMASYPREGVGFITDTSTSFSAVGIPYALAISVLGGHPGQGSANNKVRIYPGTLLQAIADPDGTEPKLLAYTFTTEEVTIANGDATNPRIDLVQMKLEYVNETESRDFQDATTRALTSQTLAVRRRVKCTLSVKQGTPAASPAYPDPDAGYCVIAGLCVGASYAGATGLGLDDMAGPALVLHDQRMPMNVRPHGALANDMAFAGTDFVPTGGFYIERINNVDGNSLYIPCHRWGNSGRLVMIDCQFRDSTALTSTIIRWNPGDVAEASLAGGNLNGSSSATMSLRRSTINQFQLLHTPAAGPTIVGNANGMGPPIWANGRRCPGVQFTGENDTSFPIEVGLVALKYTTPGTGNRWARATFHIAEGL